MWRPDDYRQLLHFHSMRHLMLAHDRVDLYVRLSISNTLCPILHQLPDLQTITLNAINGAKIGNDYFLLNLPEKITSINVAEVVDFRAVEKQFPHLVHCNAPWEPGTEIALLKLAYAHAFGVAFEIHHALLPSVVI